MTGGHHIAMALRAAYLAMHRQADAHFTRHGVTADQFVLLKSLMDAVALTQQDLVERISSDPNTVRAMLILLEARHLVIRERHPTDGRARTVALTAKGRRLLKKLWLKNEPFRQRLSAAFDADEVNTLIGHLNRIANVMKPAEPARRVRVG